MAKFLFEQLYLQRRLDDLDHLDLEEIIGGVAEQHEVVEDCGLEEVEAGRSCLPGGCPGCRLDAGHQGRQEAGREEGFAETSQGSQAVTGQLGVLVIPLVLQHSSG